MKRKVRIGIAGYGNLGKGAERAVGNNPDMELIAVFSRRTLTGTVSGAAAVSMDRIAEYKDQIDVMLLCGGSATDLAGQGPQLAALFNTVDSYDTHAKIPDYFEAMDSVAKKAGTVATISVGWDPGLFSLNRLLANAVLPEGVDYTFWGKGVSQGHSDAIRRIAGVRDARQYTIPKEELIRRIRAGEAPAFSEKQAHLRDCYVVPQPGADLNAIEQAIKTMPDYFAGYETRVTFITETEMAAKHAGTPHGGFVLRSGSSGPSTRHIMEFSLKLDSNPEFTGSVLAAYARAVFRMACSHYAAGAYTVLDIPFAWLSPKPAAQLRQDLL